MGIDQYMQVRNRTEVLCQPLQPEDFSIQVSLFASPIKWHLAHTTWFFETFVLQPYLPDYKVFNSDFSFLFNSYYNNIGERVNRANRGSLSRPATSSIFEYRQYVDRNMANLMEKSLDASIEETIELGLNHEQQHQELMLTDLKYMLSQNPLFPVYQNNVPFLNQESNEHTGSIYIDEGIYSIGYQGKGFHFDNEKGVHKVFLRAFEIDNFLVTNGEFLEFIKDGAYRNFNLWLDAGWTWIQENKIDSPMYWFFVDDQWMQFTLEGLQPIMPDEILKHVNYFEAMAFAEWKNRRLPTEFEWEIAADKLNWGKRWEWTNSAYLPYPGFTKAAGAIGEYNGKFMVNQMVLRGGSIATAVGHSRKSYRNFFHADESWQFTGIRLVK